jgi:hypothetical protein
VEYETPVAGPPYRVLLLVASTEGWYAASVEQRSNALDQLAALLRQLLADGAELVGSFDDDLFATGQPLSLPYSIYILVDVGDLAVIVRMTHALRSSELGAMIRLEARIGRSLFLLDR